MLPAAPRMLLPGPQLRKQLSLQLQSSIGPRELLRLEPLPPSEVSCNRPGMANSAAALHCCRRRDDGALHTNSELLQERMTTGEENAGAQESRVETKVKPSKVFKCLLQAVECGGREEDRQQVTGELGQLLSGASLTAAVACWRRRREREFIPASKPRPARQPGKGSRAGQGRQPAGAWQQPPTSLFTAPRIAVPRPGQALLG